MSLELFPKWFSEKKVFIFCLDLKSRSIYYLVRRERPRRLLFWKDKLENIQALSTKSHPFNLSIYLTVREFVLIHKTIYKMKP